MKVVIVTEGFKGTGYGHLMRCLAVYQAFEERGITPTFLADCDAIGRQFLGQINLVTLDWRGNTNELVRLCTDGDVVLIDSYLADLHIFEQLRKVSRQIVYLDDYLRISYPPGVVVNGAIGAEKLPYPRDGKHRYLLGIDYAPLRREFWDVSAAASRQKVENVLLIFGAQGLRALTGKTLNYLMKIFPEYVFHVVRGLDSDGASDASDSPRAKFYKNLSAREILGLMLKCDLAISAAGQTMYELARIGLPTIVVGVAENQRYNLQGWSKAGSQQCELWWEDSDVLEKLAHEIRRHSSQGGKSHTLCDGQGARRVVQYLSESHDLIA